MNSSTAKPARRTASKSHTKPSHVPEILGHISIAEAVDVLNDLDARYGLVPAVDRTQLWDAIKEVEQRAAFIGLTSAADLLAHHVELLKSLTGAINLEHFHKEPVRERLHLCRNLILTLASLSLGLSTGDLAAMQTPRGADDLSPVCESIARLPRRTYRGRRPLTSDEILLLRTNVFLRSCASPQQPPAAVYSLVEAGMTPGETTLASLDDLDDDTAPTMVLAAGNAHVESRFLRLDRFGGLILARFLSTGRKAERACTHPLTYEGRKNAAGTPAATASAQGVLDRLLKELGLFNADVTASSIRLWRLAAVYTTDGVALAQETGGYGNDKNDQDRLWRTLGYSARPAKEEHDDDEDESFLV